MNGTIGSRRGGRGRSAALAGQWAYFDTSALVKRYVVETGRRDVLRLLRQYACVTSVVLPIEIASALRRRSAEGSIDVGQLPRLQKRLAADREFWTLVEIRRDLLSSAEALASTSPLRTLDAIHVASAHLFATRMPMVRLLFVSADQRQTQAAAAIGLSTVLIRSETVRY